MGYTFVYIENTWYLKISDMETLLKYWDKFDARLKLAADTMDETKEFGRHPSKHCDAFQQLIGFMGKNTFETNTETYDSIRYDVHKEQYQRLIEGKTIYVNKNFGWNCSDKETLQFVHKSDEEFNKKDFRDLFPKMYSNLVKIERFPMGQHFYLFIDGVQIRKNKEELKFNTYEEAEEYSKQFLKK